MTHAGDERSAPRRRNRSEGFDGGDPLKTGIVDRTELDALPAAPSLEPMSGADSTAGVDLERSALARLEDLGDSLEWRRERAARRAPRAGRAKGVAPARPTAGGGILRNNLVVASGTMLSRITGLLRVVVLTAVLGSGALTDAYLIGNETPNIVYELLIGGVLAATLVPLFTSYLREDSKESEEATNVVITATLMALTALTLIAVLAAPLIFRLYTLNVEEGVDPDLLRHVGTDLTRIFLLQIFFYGVSGLLSAYLNARRQFFAAAWAPIVSNVIIIGTLLTIPRGGHDLAEVVTDRRLRLTLSLGTTVGIAAMAGVLVVVAARSGLRFRPTFQPHHPALKRLRSLSTWTLGYVISNQVVVAFVRNLADPGSGDATAYLQAYTFFVLPHGLLAVSIATTFEPDMARAVSAKDRNAFNSQASLGIRLVALLTIPASVAMFVLRRPIIGLVLQRGELSDAAALNASRALGGFALGLAGFSVYLFTLRGFYAHKDTRTAFIINAGQCLMNVVFAILFVRWWGVLGLGAALALSYLLAALWALQVLTYKVREFPLRATLQSIGRMAVAGALGGEAAWFVARHVGSNTGMEAVARMLAGSVVGLAVYVGVLAVQGAPELNSVKRVIDRRRGAAA